MQVTTAAKTETKTEAKLSLGTTLLIITFRVALVLTMVVLVAITIWAILALVGGMTSAGDPLTMISEWFKAVTGR